VAKYGKDAYYFAIFGRAYPRSNAPTPNEAVRDEIAFLALSFDGKVHVGDWQIVGREPIADDMPLPAYKEAIGAPDRIFVVDYSGQMRRPATAREIDELRHRAVVAPVRLEKALRAKHGLENWTSAYDELRPDSRRTTKALFRVS